MTFERDEETERREKGGGLLFGKADKRSRERDQKNWILWLRLSATMILL